MPLEPALSATGKMSRDEIGRLMIRPDVPPYQSNKAAFLIILLDPTSEREQTARQLAEVGGWRVLPLNSGRAEQLGPALEAILTDHAKGGPFAPSAFVLEAFHPLRHPDQTSPLPAREIVNWLTARQVFDFVPFLLYTANDAALALARQDYAFARRSRRTHLTHFKASLERNPAIHSDLALAQLLDQLMFGPSSPSDDPAVLPF